MKISFYFDEMMRRVLAEQLAKRGYVVVMANDIGMTEKSDDEHLIMATERGMALVTLDNAFAGRTIKLSDHAGLICWTRENQDTGAMLRALSDFAEQHSAEDVVGQVFWLK